MYNSYVMEVELVTSDPAVMMGKPIIAGSPITVELIYEKLAAGETVEQILDAHPRLTRDAVVAAALYSRKSLQSTTDKTHRPACRGEFRVVNLMTRFFF